MRKVILSVLLVLIVCAGLSACQEPYQKKIDEIYVYRGNRFAPVPTYKIDLKNQKFFEYLWSALPEYRFVRDLSAEKIEEFLRESARCEFTEWKERYTNINVADGHQWKIIVTFSDSSSITSEGGNKYPETWDGMYAALENLTGENILVHKSDWLNQ